MIQLVGATDAGGFQASVTTGLPAGVAEHDRMLLLGTANNSPAVVEMPDGWPVLTEDVIGTNVASYVWTRGAGEAEPASYTVEWEGSHWHFLNLVAWRGVAGIRSHAVVSSDSASTIDLPVLDARRGDVLFAFGFHWSETAKSWPGALSEITNLPRGIISAYEHITEDGPTQPHTLTAGTSGHMAATAILLTPQAAPAPGMPMPVALRAQLQLVAEEWTDISDDVRAGEITISRGRRDEGSTADTSTCQLRLDNAGGHYSPRHPDSPHFGRLKRNTPMRIGLGDDAGDVMWRFAGEVAEWPLRWDVSGTDRTVDVEAAGPLRRLAQGAPPERDALQRAITAAGPLAYWPITQEGLLRVIPSAVDGGLDMTVLGDPAPSGTLRLRATQLEWRRGELAPWLRPVAQTAGARGQISGHIAQASRSWSVDVVRAGLGDVDRIVLHTRPHPDGSAQQWRLRFLRDDGEIQLHRRPLQDDEPLGGHTTIDTWDEPRFFSATPRHVRLTVLDTGTAGSWTVTVDGEVLGSGSTVRPDVLLSVDYRWQHDDPDNAEHATVGHVTVWDQSTVPPPPSAVDLTRAMAGHDGERAGVRIQRVLEEEGMRLRAVGDLEDTPPVGPQYADDPLTVVRAAEAVDGGVLHEARDEVAMVYRTNRSRYWTGDQ